MNAVPWEPCSLTVHKIHKQQRFFARLPCSSDWQSKKIRLKQACQESKSWFCTQSGHSTKSFNKESCSINRERWCTGILYATQAWIQNLCPQALIGSKKTVSCWPLRWASLKDPWNVWSRILLGNWVANLYFPGPYPPEPLDSAKV